MSKTMTIKSLITTLAIAGSTTVATADPERGYDRGYDREYDRDYGRDRYGEPGQARIWYPQVGRRGSWYKGPLHGVWPNAGFSPLTEPTTLAGLPESFDLQRVSRIDAVKLEAVQGRTYVTSLGVTYANGETETIPVNQVIDWRHPETAAIDLGGRDRIALLTVNGTSEPGAAFRIFAAARDQRRY